MADKEIKIKDFKEGDVREVLGTNNLPSDRFPISQELFDFRNVDLKDFIMLTWYIGDGATAGNYDHFELMHFPCEVIQAYEVHRVLGTDAGAVTLDIEKLTSGQALDAGVSVLSGTFNLKSTVNTPVRVKATATDVNRVLNPGDRLALKDAGTLTAVAGVLVTVLLKIRSISIDPTA